MAFPYKILENGGITFKLLALSAFSLGVFLCSLTWTKKFDSSFLPQIKKLTVKPSENFNISISDIQVTQLYNEMARFDLIEQDTTLEDFKNVILKDWSSHNSKVILKMDGPSCREFYQYLTKTFPTNTMTLKNLFITSGLILRPDGKMYNYNTIKNAPTRSPISKQHEPLKEIFKKFSK